MKLFKKKESAIKPILSEAEVLHKLDIPDFRHMSKEKVMAFCSMIPDMNPEVAKAALEQFPNFAQMASQVVACYKELMINVFEENSKSTKSFNESCDSIIDALKSLLNEKHLRHRQKQKIIDSMMEILKMKADKDAENKEWLNSLVKTISATAGTIIAIAGTILGIKFLGKYK